MSEIENREPRLPVVYRDDHLLVVNKPTGLLAQADYSGDPDVLTLARQQTGDEGLRLAHRLDRPTSGLMVLARTKAAAQGLSRQFRERHAEKRYLAVVEGAWEGWGEAVDYLAREGDRSVVVEAAHDGAQRAALTWRVAASDDDLSLIDVLLETGRKHQIRAQVAERGHPVWGDARYGAERAFPAGGIALHAFELAVEHPAEGRVARWQAAPPGGWGGRFAGIIAAIV